MNDTKYRIGQKACIFSSIRYPEEPRFREIMGWDVMATPGNGFVNVYYLEGHDRIAYEYEIASEAEIAEWADWIRTRINEQSRLVPKSPEERQ